MCNDTCDRQFTQSNSAFFFNVLNESSLFVFKNVSEKIKLK